MYAAFGNIGSHETDTLVHAQLVPKAERDGVRLSLPTLKRYRVQELGLVSKHVTIRPKVSTPTPNAPAPAEAFPSTPKVSAPTPSVSAPEETFQSGPWDVTPPQERPAAPATPKPKAHEPTTEAFATTPNVLSGAETFPSTPEAFAVAPNAPALAEAFPSTPHVLVCQHRRRGIIQVPLGELKRMRPGQKGRSARRPVSTTAKSTPVGQRWHDQLVKIRQHLMAQPRAGLLEQLVRGWSPDVRQGYLQELQQIIAQLHSIAERIAAGMEPDGPMASVLAMPSGRARR
jgi:hypothetical protein